MAKPVYPKHPLVVPPLSTHVLVNLFTQTTVCFVSLALCFAENFPRMPLAVRGPTTSDHTYNDDSVGLRGWVPTNSVSTLLSPTTSEISKTRRGSYTITPSSGEVPNQCISNVKYLTKERERGRKGY